MGQCDVDQRGDVRVHDRDDTGDLVGVAVVGVGPGPGAVVLAEGVGDGEAVLDEVATAAQGPVHRPGR